MRRVACLVAFAAALMTSWLPQDAPATGPYSVPDVATATMSVPAALFYPPSNWLCLVRSENSGSDVTSSVVCYSETRPFSPPPPPPPYEPALWTTLTGTLDESAGVLSLEILDCTEFLPEVFGAGVAVDIQFDKAGGANGSVTITQDSTPPFDCADGTQTTGPLTLTPLPQSHDEDGDGCADWEELGEHDEVGGARDPFNFWDFYDTPDASNQRDRLIDLFNDIFGVSNRFGGTDDNNRDGVLDKPVNRYFDPLAGPIPPEPAYHPAFDRGPPLGPNAWNLGPADGAIDLFNDVFGVSAQFGHACQDAP